MLCEEGPEEDAGDVGDATDFQCILTILCNESNWVSRETK